MAFKVPTPLSRWQKFWHSVARRCAIRCWYFTESYPPTRWRWVPLRLSFDFRHLTRLDSFWFIRHTEYIIPNHVDHRWRSDARRAAVYVATVLYGIAARVRFKSPSTHRRYLSSGIQLQGFADVSTKGYVATIYFRSINAAGEISIKFITCKTKVAPF